MELDRGQGIPFEGNYSQWLEQKAKRLQAEEQAQASRDRAILREFDYVTKQRQGQQKKGKARLRAYEQLVEEANAFVRASTLDSITIPVGPRLGDVVVEAKELVKARFFFCLAGTKYIAAPSPRFWQRRSAAVWRPLRMLFCVPAGKTNRPQGFGDRLLIGGLDFQLPPSGARRLWK